MTRLSRGLAVAAVAAGITVPSGCSLSSDGPEEQAVEVPAEVVELVESLPDSPEAALAEEAVGLAEPDEDERDGEDSADDREDVENGGLDQMLPEAATIEVRPDSWSQEGATASVIADVSVPGFDPVAFLVVLATDEPVDRDPRDDGNDAPDIDSGTWRISGTFPWEAT